MAEWLAAMVNPDCELTSSFADGLETAVLMLDIYEAPA